jgi:pSer/pThr/pTyr-binding forkhead associated (FHA) protein
MRVKLKVILSDGRCYDWSHEGAAVSIGRDPACELAVEDSQERHASWMHARIEWDGRTFLVRDFQSKNGTYVNEDLIDGAQSLKVGDTIRLGRKGPKLIALELDPDQGEASPGPPSEASASGPL